ncbi:MAG: trimethylamine methyltransferase family protein [Anaerolineae bacterium]
MIREAVEGGQFAPLSPANIWTIHHESLDILSQVGVNVPLASARQRFRSAGALVDEKRVRIPTSMVEDALSSVPHSVLLASRDGQSDLLLEGRRVHFGTGGSPSLVLPPGEDGVRPALLRDVAQLARLAQRLEQVDFFVLPVTPTDIPPEKIAVHRFYAALRHTTKHIMGGLVHLEGARQVLEMGIWLAGGEEALRQRPFISCMTSWMVSPLTFDPDVTEILTFWCEHGMPVALSSAPMAGSTSPMTLAGTLVQLNAEQLAGMVYTQLVRRGTPVLAGYIPGQMNPSTGGYLGGTPEFGLMQAAAAQLAQFYNVPIYCSAGMSDAKVPDFQAGAEKTLTLLLTAMAGASYIHHAVGMIENMNAVSYEQMALDNDLILMVKRVLRGITVDVEHMAGEAIRRAGPSGHYLMDEHTLRHMRTEMVFPRLMDRSARETWTAAGRHTARQRAAQWVLDVLTEPAVPCLSSEQDSLLRKRFGVHDGLEEGHAR